MTMWKQLSMAAAGAALMFASAAFAQQATGTDTTKAGMGDERVKAVQQALRDKGHDPGTVDGRMGPKTQAALRDYQKAQGMETTGRLDAKTIQSLGIDGGKTGSAGPSATSGSASPTTSGAGDKK